MPHLKLFSTNFDLFEPSEKAYSLHVGKGLNLRVSPTGHKSWQYKYSHKGKNKTFTIGSYEFTELEDVLHSHTKARKLLSTGICPAAEVKRIKDEELASRLTINDITDMFIDEHVSKLKRPEQPIYIINKHIRPNIGSLQACEITTKHIHKITANIAPTVARKIVERLQSIYQHAINKGFLDMANPLAGKVSSYGTRGGRTKRTLSFVELEQFVTKLDHSELNPSFVNASLLLLATGQRKSEVLNAKWQDIDFEQKTLTIPQERVKTATSDNNDKEDDNHIVHLSEYAISLLKEQYSRTRRFKLIFGDVSGNSYNEALTAAFKALGMRHFTPHDLRRTFYSRNVDRHEGERIEFILEKIFNHTMKGTMAHYNLAKYWNEQVGILNEWGAFLQGQAT